MQLQKFSDVSSVYALFPKTVEDIQDRANRAIEDSQKELDALLAIPHSERTFANTALAYDRLGSHFGILCSPISVTKMVTNSDEMRQAAQEAILKIQGFAVDAFTNTEIYNAFKGYLDGNKKNETLSAEEQYFLDETMRGFVHSGLALPEKELEALKVVKKELAKLSLQFSTNIATDKSSITVTRDGLKDLSDEFIDGLKTVDGKYVLTCDYPTYFEVMQYCGVESTRRGLYLAFNNRAYPANVGVLEEVIAKRDDLAKKIGFESYAHLDLDSEMIKSPKRAQQFIDDLLSKVAAKEEQEFKRLISDLPEGMKLTDKGTIAPWNFSFASAYYKKKHFDIDSRKIAEYFPMEKTVDALFDIYQKFFSLSFTQEKAKGLWDEDVTLIKVSDKESGTLLGYVFMDLYPRPNKYSHACHCGIVSAIEWEEKGAIHHRPSVAVVIANFPKSTATRPSLLKHGDVTTFFHEFGHGIHALLGSTKLASFSGTATKTDFVEMPSQMLEEWMWNRDILKSVSSHYQTGKHLPDALIDKMVALKKFDSGHFVQRQCCLAMLSLSCFTEGAKKDTSELWQHIITTHSPHLQFESEGHFQASFGHLMGYGSGYYSYMWSKVFALDLFSEIRKQGLLNTEIGMKLRKQVLGKGGSVDPNILLRDFLGREPNQNAFLSDLGLS